MLLFDLHTHTCFSHGKGTPEDNVREAIANGLKKIAITDHAPGHKAYGVRDVNGYFKEIERLKKKYNGIIEVLSGMEFNLLVLKGQTDLTEEFEKLTDVRLVGFHKLAIAGDFAAFCYYSLTSRKDIIKNTDAYISLAESGKFDVITHPGYALKLDAKEFARACARTDTLIEINEKHNDFTLDELRTAAAEGAKFIISSDAHTSQSVGRVPAALNAAEQAGVLQSVVNVAEDGSVEA